MTTLSLGQRIRELRMRKGITQIELAKGLCTPSMISQIESDRARPSYKVLVAIADRLSVPLEQLLKEVHIDLEYTSKYKLALGMVRAKECKTAIPLLEDLLKIEQHRIPKENLLLELSLCLLESGNAVEAESRLNQLYQLVNACHDEEMLALVLLHLGKVAMLKNEYPISLFHTNRAWDELQKVEEPDPELQSKVLIQLATINEKLGKAAEAAKYYESALVFYKGNSEERAKTYLRLAEVYDRQKKFEQAEEYASKACALLEEKINLEQRHEMQHRLVMLQRESSDWRVAVSQLLTIAEQYERDGDKSKAGEVDTDIASVCLENEEFDEAWAYAEKARMSLPDTASAIGKAHRVLSFVYFHRKDEKKGQKHLDNAIKIFEQHGNVSELEEVTLQMCRYLSNKGEHQEAYERMERFHHYTVGQLEQRGIVL